MGLFGIVSRDGAGAVEIKKLDLNVWCLPRPFFGYTFYCDVGIDLVASGDGVDQLLVALPFGTKGFEDLGPALEHHGIASLVFGEPVKVTAERSRSVLLLRGEEIRIARVSTDDTHLDAHVSTSEFSLWCLRLAAPLEVNARSYVRVRFPVRALGRFWIWGPARARGRQASVDVRVSDLREAAALTKLSGAADRLLAIERLNCFVIVPDRFEQILCSPNVRYLRLLEAGAWKAYLPGGSRQQKLLVYYWRSDDVTRDKEFRGFLTMTTGGSGLRWDVLAAATFCAAVAAALFQTPDGIAKSVVALAGDRIRTYVHLWVLLVLGGLVVLWHHLHSIVALWEILRAAWRRRRGKSGPSE